MAKIGNTCELASKLALTNFMQIKLGRQSYHALFDPEATISVVGSKIAEQFKIQPAESSLPAVMG